MGNIPAIEKRSENYDESAIFNMQLFEKSNFQNEITAQEIVERLLPSQNFFTFKTKDG